MQTSTAVKNLSLGVLFPGCDSYVVKKSNCCFELAVKSWLQTGDSQKNKNLMNMERYIVLAIVLFFKLNLLAQAQLETKQHDLYQTNESEIKTYRIFPTVNMWYFIKLNTRTGQMWQVEFDLKKTEQLGDPLNRLSLVEEHEEVDNRFTLYPTHSNWSFLLLDQLSGKIWQVNWDTKPEKCTIFSLNNASLIEKQNIAGNRFTLYPTQNSWNFLLLDKIDGTIWQVYWSTKPGEGKIISIQ
ncbi:MAG: hypothetical protein ACK5JD_16365 [Mangrovibacterium sp.]